MDKRHQCCINAGDGSHRERQRPFFLREKELTKIGWLEIRGTSMEAWNLCACLFWANKRIWEQERFVKDQRSGLQYEQGYWILGSDRVEHLLEYSFHRLFHSDPQSIIMIDCQIWREFKPCPLPYTRCLWHPLDIDGKCIKVNYAIATNSVFQHLYSKITKHLP